MNWRSWGSFRFGRKRLREAPTRAPAERDHDQPHHADVRLRVCPTSMRRTGWRLPASTMTRNRSRTSPGLRGDASAPSSICPRSACKGRRNRWCRSIRLISMPHSKRTTSNHDRYKHSATQCPSDPPRHGNTSLYRRASCSAEGRVRSTGSARGHLSHHRHAPAERRFAAIPYSKRRRTS